MKEAAGWRGSIHLAAELPEEFALVLDVIEDHLANLLGSLRVGSGERVFSPMVRAGRSARESGPCPNFPPRGWNQERAAFARPLPENLFGMNSSPGRAILILSTGLRNPE
jgi:hypothetical protein